MTSAIDPTRPLSGVPASKADLRANLATVKVELEHGGFVDGLTPANYGPPASSRTIDHLQAIDDALGAGVGSKTAFADLVDTPSGYTGQANRYPRVNADESGLEFVDQAAGGDASTTSYTSPHKGAVTRSVQDKLRDVISVKDFGAVGDGSTDDTAAFNAARDALFEQIHPFSGASQQVLSGQTTARVVGAQLFIPPGHYRVKNFTLSKSIKMIGVGRGSRLSPTADATSTDYVLRIVNPANAYKNFGNHQPGIVLEDFMIDGIARTINCNGIYGDFIQHNFWNRLVIEEVQGHGIFLDRSCRESVFSGLNLRWCGDATRAQVSIVESAASGDAHNNLRFDHCFFIYPLGDNMRIGGNPANSSPTRGMFINSCMFHGTADNLYNRLAPSRMLVVAGGERIVLSHCRIHAWANGEGAIYGTYESGEDPSTGKRCLDLTMIACNWGSPTNNAGNTVASPAIRTDARLNYLRNVAPIFTSNVSTAHDNVDALTTYEQWP